MPLYLKRWDDGDVSLIQASNSTDASIIVDALGDPGPPESIRRMSDMAINLTLAADKETIVVNLDQYIGAGCTNDAIWVALGLPTVAEIADAERAAEEAEESRATQPPRVARHLRQVGGRKDEPQDQ